MSEGYKTHSLMGPEGISRHVLCETDQAWRYQLGMFKDDRQQKFKDNVFDECQNAFIRPQNKTTIDLLEHLPRAEVE